MHFVPENFIYILNIYIINIILYYIYIHKILYTHTHVYIKSKNSYAKNFSSVLT